METINDQKNIETSKDQNRWETELKHYTMYIKWTNKSCKRWILKHLLFLFWLHYTAVTIGIANALVAIFYGFYLFIF